MRDTQEKPDAKPNEAPVTDTYEQIYDGEWVRVNVTDYRNQCCDCGLVHNLKFKKLKRGLMMRVTTNRRATAAVRRAFKFEKDRQE